MSDMSREQRSQETPEGQTVSAQLATERSQGRVRVVWSEGPEARVRAALAHLRMLEAHCPCGHRPETPQTHPHAPGCAVYQAIRLLDGEHAEQAAWDVAAEQHIAAPGGERASE